MGFPYCSSMSNINFYHDQFLATLGLGFPWFRTTQEPWPDTRGPKPRCMLNVLRVSKEEGNLFSLKPL